MRYMIIVLVVHFLAGLSGVVSVTGRCSKLFPLNPLGAQSHGHVPPCAKDCDVIVVWAGDPRFTPRDGWINYVWL